MLLHATSQGLTFLVAAFLARQLGASSFGVYAFVTALVTVIGIPLQAGLPLLVLRETARATAEAAWSRMIGVWKWSSGVTSALATALAGLALLAVIGLGEKLDPSLGIAIIWGVALMAFRAQTMLRGAAIQGLQEVLLGKFPDLVVRPALFMVLLLAVAAFGPLTPDRAMALHAAAAAGALLVATLLRRQHQPSPSRTIREPEYDVAAWVTSAGPFALLAGLNLVSANTDLIMLGLLASSTEVGAYRVAAQCSALVAFGLHATNLVTSPRLALIHAGGDEQRLRRVAQESARLAIAVALPAALVLILSGKTVLVLLFGREFEIAFISLAILSAGQLINASFGLVGMLLNMTGHERDTVLGAALAAGINVAANLVLIPRLGMEGAALSTLLSLTVWNVFLWWIAKRRLGFSTLSIDFPSRP